MPEYAFGVRAADPHFENGEGCSHTAAGEEFRDVHSFRPLEDPEIRHDGTKLTVSGLFYCIHCLIFVDQDGKLL